MCSDGQSLLQRREHNQETHIYVLLPRVMQAPVIPAIPVIPRQYDIEVGPWQANGIPNRRIHLNNVQTNSNYDRCELMRAAGAMPVGLLYSRDGFLRHDMETPEDVQSLWFLN